MVAAATRAIPDDPTEVSVRSLAARIRSKEWSPTEVLEAHIQQIERVNPKINALVADRFAEARREAKAMDERLVNGTEGLPPLFGVPCTIKEFFEVEGMPNTAGLHFRRGIVADRDAVVVERLRRAGAIIMGVTNVPEGGMWVETVNKLYGRTSNPWDLARTCGGSSGGEAALIACGASPFGIGSDIAGSVRIPAAFCGVVAHKPSGRRVPNAGHWGTIPETAMYLVGGPMGRTVDDLASVLAIIEGPDARSPIVQPFTSVSLDEVDLAGVTATPLVRVGRVTAGKSMRTAVSEAMSSLESRGVKSRALDESPLSNPFSLWSNAMSDAMQLRGGSFYDDIGCGQEFSLWPELLRSTVGRSRFTFPALGLVALERLRERVPSGLLRRSDSVATVIARLEDMLGPSGVFIVPPYRQPAPRHKAALMSPFDFLFCGVFSILEMPSTMVPTGVDAQGLPVGVQVVGRRGNDHLTLAVARAIEAELGGWRRAPL